METVQNYKQTYFLWCICTSLSQLQKITTSYKLVFEQKMLRVKEEELFLRERRDNSHHRRRRYSEDYDSEVDLYQQYKAAGFNTDMVDDTAVNIKYTHLIRELYATVFSSHSCGPVTMTTSRLSVPSCVRKL